MKPTTLLLWPGLVLANVIASCANVPAPSTAETARLNEARALLADEPLRALDVAEPLLAGNPDWREARLVVAEGSLRLAQSGASQANLHLHDAAANFEKALDGVEDADAPQALMMLAQCRHDLGEFETAREAALRAAKGYAATDLPEHRVAAARALLLAGTCDLRRLVAARQGELDAGGAKDNRGVVPIGREVQQLAAAAAQEFGAARRELPGDAALQLRLLHSWLGQPSEEMRELERGLREAPDHTGVHDAYLEWMAQHGQFDALLGAYARLVREQPSTPIYRWHQGRAQFTHADKLFGDGNFLGALAAYGKADHTFGEYLAMVPAHAEGANAWRVSCRLAMSRCALDAGDLRAAQQHLFAAADAGAADSASDRFAASAFAIHVALNDSGDDALARSLAFNEQLLQRWPDRWDFVYNNAALAARDLGVQKAKGGDDAAAKELWERSYHYYEKAMALAPTDARIVNDTGLMLIYHLDRDLDLAQRLFERAVELGKQQLAALPADAPARERERLEEAVGDAWQNQAVLAREQRKAPFAEYRRFCEEAVKYYPYQRREAAALLRSEGNDGLQSTARSDTAARLAAQQGGAADALAKRRADVDAKVKAEDFDGALAVLDELAKDCKDHAPFQLLKGEITLKLAAQAREQGRKGVDLFYQDAVAALKRAVELDSEPVPPRRLLAQAQYESGDVDAATKTLAGILLHMQSQGGGAAEDLLAVHTLRANAAARAYAAKKQANEDDKELLTAARASFRFLEEKGKLVEELRTSGKVDGSLLQLWSTTEQWAGAGAEAVNVYVRALAKAPEDTQLLGALVKVGFDTQQLPLVVEALAKKTDATSLWYLGDARFWLADVERAAKRTAEAQKTLDAAREAFASSMQKNATYRDSSEQKIAAVLTKKGHIAFWSDDLANAETWLLESAKLRPDQIAADPGNNGETTKLGLMRVADKHFRAGDLGKTEAIYRTASDVANSDADLLNNSGLFARDHGNALERDGKQKEAMLMYEQSYKAYRRAQQLDPANVRLRNDCALIAIWHLERDWDLAKQLLDGAIADGTKTLAENPPADANDKQMLDEAVGDCYENLALWHLKHDKDAKAAKAAAEASLKHHPRERRPNARRHLQAAERLLQGK